MKPVVVIDNIMSRKLPDNTEIENVLDLMKFRLSDLGGPQSSVDIFSKKKYIFEIGKINFLVKLFTKLPHKAGVVCLLKLIVRLSNNLEQKP